MHIQREPKFPHRTQSGAALAVALILLVALTLLAVSSMNNARLDLMMVGNEQFRNRSFEAAEAGISNALLSPTNFNSGSDYSLPSAAAVAGGNATYTYTITRPNAGNPEPIPSGGYTMDSNEGIQAITFRIRSIGNATHNATSTIDQELFIPTRGDGMNYMNPATNTGVCVGSIDSTC